MKKHLFILFSLIAILVILLFVLFAPPKVIPEENVPTVATSTDEIVTLSIREKISFNDIMIEPSAIIEDSRCPEDVQCIQAGRARIALNIYSLEGEHIFTKELEEGAFFYAGSTKITLEKVNPFPVSTQMIGEGEYRFEVLLEVIE